MKNKKLGRILIAILIGGKITYKDKQSNTFDLLKIVLSYTQFESFMNLLCTCRRLFKFWLNHVFPLCKNLSTQTYCSIYEAYLIHQISFDGNFNIYKTDKRFWICYGNIKIFKRKKFDQTYYIYNMSDIKAKIKTKKSLNIKNVINCDFFIDKCNDLIISDSRNTTLEINDVGYLEAKCSIDVKFINHKKLPYKIRSIFPNVINSYLNMLCLKDNLSLMFCLDENYSFESYDVDWIICTDHICLYEISNHHEIVNKIENIILCGDNVISLDRYNKLKTATLLNCSILDVPKSLKYLEVFLGQKRQTYEKNKRIINQILDNCIFEPKTEIVFRLSNIGYFPIVKDTLDYLKKKTFGNKNIYAYIDD